MDAQDFDAWSKSYDESVLKQETYPFAGYDEIVEEVINQTNGQKVLDLGIGTGNIASQLVERGLDIIGLDFSEEMLRLANEKIPEADLRLYDANEKSPEFDHDFDTVIMTYFIHHFHEKRQEELINQLMKITKKLIIGDVMTYTASQMEWVKEKDYKDWDDNEWYITVEHYLELFPDYEITFIRKSYCSGVLIFTHK